MPKSLCFTKSSWILDSIAVSVFLVISVDFEKQAFLLNTIDISYIRTWYGQFPLETQSQLLQENGLDWIEGHLRNSFASFVCNMLLSCYYSMSTWCQLEIYFMATYKNCLWLGHYARIEKLKTEYARKQYSWALKRWLMLSFVTFLHCFLNQGVNES